MKNNTIKLKSIFAVLLFLAIALNTNAQIINLVEDSNGGSLISCPEEFSSSFSCDELNDGVLNNDGWASEVDPVSPIDFDFEFSGSQTATISNFGINTGTAEGEYWSRNIEIYTSSNGGTSFTLQVTDELPDDNTTITYPITPVSANVVRLRIIDGYRTDYWELAEFQAFGSYTDPCDGTDPANLDTDGDTVADACDLDDDNDGILDVDETDAAVSVSDNTSDYTENTPQSGTLNIGGQNVDISIEAPEEIDDIGSVIDLSTAEVGSFTVTMDFPSDISSLTLNIEDFDALPDESLNNFNNLPSSVSGGLTLSSGQVTSNSDNNDNGVINWTGLSTSTITFDFNSNGDSSVFRITDMAFTLLSDIDTDTDTVVNRLDLDSDNDGIFDALEANAGVTLAQLDSNGRFTGGVNSDGVPIAANGGVGFTPLNTNTATDANVINLDSDADGCSDANEYYNDQNIDGGDGGEFGTGTPSVDANGLVTSAGYDGTNIAETRDDTLNVCLVDPCDGTDPANLDTDGDGVADSCDIDDDNDGILDTVEGISNEEFRFVPGAVADFPNGVIGPLINGTISNFPLPNGQFIDIIVTTNSSSSTVDVIDGITQTLLVGPNIDYNIKFVDSSTGQPFFLNGFIFNLSDLEASTFTETFEFFSYVTENGTITSGNGNGWAGWTDVNGIEAGAPGSFLTVTSNDELTSSYPANSNPQNNKFARFDISSEFISEIEFRSSPATASFGGFLFGWLENVQVLEIDINSDGDALINSLDLDSDNDGIPDNIEAQTTQDYIVPTYTDTDGDGLMDVYDATPNGTSDGAGSIGLIPVDTDGDGTPDTIDADSDDDGITDLNESFFDRPQGVVGSNGLLSSVETTDNYDDVNGNAYDAGEFTIVDRDNDTALDGNNASPLGVDFDYRDNTNDECDAGISANPDQDGDGLTNLCDLDNDNDGILDVDECDPPITLTLTAGTGVYTASGNSSGLGDTTFYPNVGNFLGTDIDLRVTVTSVDPGIEADIDNPVSAQSSEPLLTVLRGAGGIREIYGQVGVDFEYFVAGTSTPIDVPVIINFWDIDRTGATQYTIEERSERITVNTNDVLTYTVQSTGNIIPANNGATYSFTASTFNSGSTPGVDNIDHVVRVAFKKRSGYNIIFRKREGSTGYGFGNSTFSSPSTTLLNFCEEDFDGDNIPNVLDLDSDNDGIPDNIEAQTTQAYTPPNNDNATTIRDNNGVNSAYLAGLTPVDTDGDGVPDIYDTDSDNDGLFDIDEAGIRLADNDTDDDGFTDNSVGINGLENANGIESADNYDDINGLAHDNTNFFLDDDDNDVPTGGDYDWRDIPAGEQLFGTRIISSLQNGTVVPNKIDAYLNIVANNWGVVITRVNGVASINNAVEGMIVFDTSDDTFKVCTEDTAPTPVWRAFRQP